MIYKSIDILTFTNSIEMHNSFGKESIPKFFYDKILLLFSKYNLTPKIGEKSMDNFGGVSVGYSVVPFIEFSFKRGIIYRVFFNVDLDEWIYCRILELRETKSGSMIGKFFASSSDKYHINERGCYKCDQFYGFLELIDNICKSLVE